MATWRLPGNAAAFYCARLGVFPRSSARVVQISATPPIIEPSPSPATPDQFNRKDEFRALRRLRQEMPDVPGELVSGPAGRKMARPGQDQQPGTGIRRRDHLGVGALDRLVMIPVGHQYRRLDRGKLRLGPVRLRRPHLADRTPQTRRTPPESRTTCVFVARPRDERGEGRVLLNPSTTPDGSVLAAKANTLSTRPGCLIARSIPRMPPSLHPTTPPSGFAGNRATHDVVGHQVVAVRAIVPGAAAMAAAVQNDHVWRSRRQRGPEGPSNRHWPVRRAGRRPAPPGRRRHTRA